MQKGLIVPMDMNKAIDQIMAAGLSVMERENHSNSKQVNHLSIIGGVRRVEFYPTTGTVFANKVTGRNEQGQSIVLMKVRHGKGLNFAISLAKGIQ